MQFWFAVAMTIYLLLIYAIAWRASSKVQTKDDFVLAGRQLPWGLSTITLIATWFGAESMMTVANEVSQAGIRQAMLDPIGIALCLLLAGTLFAKRLWRMQILTIGDFFQQKYGGIVERLSVWLLFPSYFGWIGAQLLAMATVLHTVFGTPPWLAILVFAMVGAGYAMLGGMWSVSWIDVGQMAIIIVGLLVLSIATLLELGHGRMMHGLSFWFEDAPNGFWRLEGVERTSENLSMALGALAIGALGNLPVQDLLQRILSAKSQRVAAWSCNLAALGYLLLGALPVAIGFSAAILIPEAVRDGQDVVTVLTQTLLSPPLQIILLLAILSAALSTFVSAVMSPAVLIGHNLIEPRIRSYRQENWSDRDSVWLQRACVLGVSVVSIILTQLGHTAYELLQASYAMSLVSLTVPFCAGWFDNMPSRLGAILSMVLGVLFWALHFSLGWDWFLQGFTSTPILLPQEIGCLLVGLLGYGAGRVWEIQWKAIDHA